LKSIPDLKLNELAFNKAKARCCGGGGGLWNYNYQISMDCAANRLSDDFVPLNTDLLATSCPLCQTNFRLTAKRRSIPLKVFDITEIVNSTMKMSPVSI
jgi:Fe-S oxidoreductase